MAIHNPRVIRAERINRLLVGTEYSLIQPNEPDAVPHLFSTEDEMATPLPQGMTAALDAIPDALVLPFVKDFCALLDKEAKGNFSRGVDQGMLRQAKQFRDAIGITEIRDAITDGFDRLAEAVAENR